MSPRLLCYALAAITLLLTMVGLGVLDPSTSGSRSIQAIVSAASSAGSDNKDNSPDNRDNADNTADNTADNRGADNGAADNGRDNSSSSGGNTGRGNTGGQGNTAGRGTTGGTTSQADNLNENFDSLFDDDEFDDDDDDDDGGGSRDGIEDFDLGLPPLPSPADVEIAERVTICAPSGQETTVRTPDGRASVQVPASMPQSVQLTLRSISITSPTIPPTSGLRLGGLIVGLDAEHCGGGAMAALPAEANLVIRYSDLDASAFDEARLVVALLDPATQQWKPVPNQVADPAGNAVSATITSGGVYTIYQTLGWATRRQELGQQAGGDAAEARPSS